MVIMSIFAGAELISGDLKFKSFTLYLSRPLGRFDYVKGKFSIVLFYLLSLTLGPAIVLIVFKMIFYGEFPCFCPGFPRCYYLSHTYLLIPGLPLVLCCLR